MRALLPFAFLAACGGGGSSGPDAPMTVQPTANPAREIVNTQLTFDVTAKTGTAIVTFAPSDTPGATVEVGDLGFDHIQWDGLEVPTGSPAPGKMDLGLPASSDMLDVTFTYRWNTHEGFTGISANGYTLIWPYYCGNMFPCHSQPADGTTFTLAVSGVPDGKMAVFPAAITSEAPSYQVAWSIDAYTKMDVGTTTAGTAISVWYRSGEQAAATTGTQHLVAAFDWFEKTLGPYRFGNEYGSVSVAWPRGAFGGMEHHPFVHIASAAIGDEETNVHEAAHGWFGDGIRIQCWEDFVLSEGTVSYLAARALDVVAPSVGASVWSNYQSQLSGIAATDPVWPQSCGVVDIIKDNLFSQAPYMRGAFFYKGVADKLGNPQLLDVALATYFQAHAGQTGTMQEMLDTIKAVTGYDATSCAQMWLEQTSSVPTPGPCP
ncbi:MAG TPA: M1 family aminopeptidase [Kofleriaceae bacterium]|nr:M1 family aminopeptidase [Kofleriaceae bacterium]